MTPEAEIVIKQLTGDVTELGLREKALSAEVERLRKALEKIGDAVSLSIDGKDCTVDGFCEAISSYQKDSMKLDALRAEVERLKGVLHTIAHTEHFGHIELARAALNYGDNDPGDTGRSEG
jgi:hypothetical protein